MDWRESRAGKRWLAVNEVRVVHDLWHGVPRVRYFVHPKRQRVKTTWLARARLLSGQSVAQAAKACGLSPRSWERWEQGRSLIPSAAALSILNGLTITPAELLSSGTVRVNPATLEVML